MRILVALALLLPMAAADDAERYFEIGLDYLKKGLYEHATDAFSESLLAAPGEPVPLAFLGLAVAASERRHFGEAALILRTAYTKLAGKEALRLDLRMLMPSPEALAMLHRDFVRRLRGKQGRLRRDVLGVLAFLEVHDGSPNTAPHLAKLLKDHPDSAYGLALKKLQRVGQ